MNQDLVEGRFNQYSPFILKLYDSVEKCIFPIEKSKLYKGIILPESDLDDFLQRFRPKVKDTDLPPAILYSASFFSFYKDEKTVKKFRETKGDNMRSEIFIWSILEGTDNFRFIKNQACIEKEISYYESDDEVLFFPFSCFEIKKFEKKENTEKDYIITLNYLDSYSNLFNPEERRTFINVTKNDYSKMVFDSGLINPSLIEMPPWLNNFNINLQNNKKIELLLNK